MEIVIYITVPYFKFTTGNIHNENVFCIIDIVGLDSCDGKTICKYLFHCQKYPSQFFDKIDALKNLSKSTGKHMCRSLLFNNVPDLRPATRHSDKVIFL